MSNNQLILPSHNKTVIDVCCGGRMFWTNPKDSRAVFMDKRVVPSYTASNGSLFSVEPDIVGDFRNIPFQDDSFSCVVFDPPHLRCGETSFMYEKYGTLDRHWKEDLTTGFSECFRILKPNGTLIFKWCDSYKQLSEILKLTSQVPLITHSALSRSKQNHTHFCVFIKS